MTTAIRSKRKSLIIPPTGGRIYAMGKMRAVFKADNAETDSIYSLSEWWLEPDTSGPGLHAHPEEHIYYVLEGTLSVCVDGEWSDAERGSCILIAGGTQHDFQNRGSVRCGFLNVNIPGGFELEMPAIAQWFAENPPGSVDA